MVLPHRCSGVCNLLGIRAHPERFGDDRHRRVLNGYTEKRDVFDGIDLTNGGGSMLLRHFADLDEHSTAAQRLQER